VIRGGKESGERIVETIDQLKKQSTSSLTTAVFDALGHSHLVALGTPEKKDVTLSEPYVCLIESHPHLTVRALTTGYLYVVKIKEGQAVAQSDLLFRIIPAADTEVLASENAVSIAAPFAGVIGSALVPKGTLVQKGDALTTLADSSQMNVDFNVPEARYLNYQAAKLSEHLDDLEIELMLGDRSTFNQHGKLVSMGSEFNPQTGNITFRADFPNPDRLLRHGMTGKVILHRVQHNAIVIPQCATFEVLNKWYVYVVAKDNVAHQRQIEIQAEIDDVFVVKSGVGVDDEIVVDGIRPLMDANRAERDDRVQVHPNAGELPTP